MRIFLVYPDPQMANAMARRLRESLNAEVEVFDDGLGLYLAMGRTVTDPSQCPDAIVIDAAAPRIGGLLLARLLKYNVIASHAPILVTTTACTAGPMQRDAEMAHVDALVEIDPAADASLTVDLVVARVAAAVKSAAAT